MKRTITDKRRNDERLFHGYHGLLGKKERYAIAQRERLRLREAKNEK